MEQLGETDPNFSSHESPQEFLAAVDVDENTGETLLGRGMIPDPLPFPGEDGGRSLVDMANRDLQATLQLLAGRARHVTGASVAVIALLQGEIMVCRASAGPSAPKAGQPINLSSGLAEQSLHTQEVLLCQDTANDPRVNLSACQARNIASAMVMPLVREQQVIGVFELLSKKKHAFQQRDIAALERLGEMIQTALDHAEAAARAQNSMLSGAGSESPAEEFTAVTSSLFDRSKIGECSACGFPVSVGRTLCLDCDSSYSSTVSVAADSEPIPESLPEFDSSAPAQASWLQSHKYLIGAVLLATAILAAALWIRH